MKKTVFDKSVLKFIGAVCLLAIVVSSFRVVRLHSVSCPEVKILVSAPKIVENTPFTVSAISPGISGWEWDFGDGSKHETSSNVTHTYHLAGNYNLRVILNGSTKCTNTMAMVVTQDRSATSTSSDDVIESSIEGPSTATVGHPVKFHETSGKGTSWAWTSSESNGVIDGTGQEITYTFTSPGTKTVYVSINGNKGKASTNVEVTAPASGGGGATAPKITEDAFRKMLLQVVNRKADVNVFKDCVCGRINMVITVVDKKGKPYALDGYCKELKDRAHRTDFDEIKLITDPKTGCITSIVVKEHTGSLAPWRK